MNPLMIKSPHLRSSARKARPFLAIVGTEAQDGLVRVDGNAVDLSTSWELDVYSRPVLTSDGKKLWEVLLTSSEGKMRFVRTLPSNSVNSKAVKEAVESCIEEVGERGGDCKEIRFFRGQMFNMINIALSSIDVVTKPSRATYALLSWLGERERDVYPKMEGYKESMSQAASSGVGSSFLDIRTPIKLPDALRGERYAFVSLPLSEFMEGGGVNEENIGVGRLCPVQDGLPADEFVQGVVVMTKRAKALAAWMAGTEVCGISCDLRKRQMVMEADISTQYLVAKLDDSQRKEGVAFEEGKERLGGLHFLCVQEDEDDEEPKGVWLLRETDL